MNTISDQTPYFKRTFRDFTGYIVAPWIPGATNDYVAIRHSAFVDPWIDRDIHFHKASEEFYFLFSGELKLIVDGSLVTLRPFEVLLVRPEVPHAVIGGKGPIEHFVIRMPVSDDRETVGRIPKEGLSVVGEAQRELQSYWGCRVPLKEKQFQNCWLFGIGQARFHSDLMCLAYLRFSTDESIEADNKNHRHNLHLHKESHEYYTVLKGTKILQIENEFVEINAGENLEVLPNVKHVLHAIQTPFEGFTFRVPRLNDKIEF